jgi:four helix bundle protein
VAGVIAERFEDLTVWQLANRVRIEVVAICARSPARSDFRYCNQMRDASRSACRNIAEGFGRFRPTEFAHFLEMAAGSLQEVKDGIGEAVDLGYIDEETHTRLVRLTLRALKANFRLREYLQSEHASRAYARLKTRRHPREP